MYHILFKIQGVSQVHMKVLFSALPQNALKLFLGVVQVILGASGRLLDQGESFQVHSTSLLHHHKWIITRVS